jgi:hypothetical protein
MRRQRLYPKRLLAVKSSHLIFLSIILGADYLDVPPAISQGVCNLVSMGTNAAGPGWKL